MQNEELRKSQEELERWRSEYADLYDLAPVGYLTLDKTGLITRANLTTSNLLGIERSRFIKRPIALFVHLHPQGAFRLCKQATLNTTTPQICRLVMKRKNGGRRILSWVRLRVRSLSSAKRTVATADGRYSVPQNFIPVTNRLHLFLRYAMLKLKERTTPGQSLLPFCETL